MTDPYAAAEGLVRVYPAREPNGSALVWAHGGAFAFGDLDLNTFQKQLFQKWSDGGFQP